MCVNILFIATVCEVECLFVLIRHPGVFGGGIPNNVQMEMVSGTTHFTQFLHFYKSQYLKEINKY